MQINVKSFHIFNKKKIQIASETTTQKNKLIILSALILYKHRNILIELAVDSIAKYTMTITITENDLVASIVMLMQYTNGMWFARVITPNLFIIDKVEAPINCKLW